MRVLVGLGTCGIAAGAEGTYQAFAEQQAKSGGACPWTLAKTGCVGACYREPIVEIQHDDGRRYQYGS